MKATQLRIGNLIYGPSNRVESVIGIESDGTITTFLSLSNNSGLTYKTTDYGSVPLTEEWLTKFGFEKIENSSYPIFHKDNFYFEIVNHKKLGFIFPKYWSIKILAVHQLQNLYFALTGEELTIK